MIHEIGVALQAAMRAKGCPLDVLDGEHTKTTTWGRQRIVLDFDDTKRDSFGPALSQRHNAHHLFTDSVPCVLTIYAQSSASGATVFEHRRVARRVLRLSLVELRTIGRGIAFKPTDGGFIVPDDLKASEKQGGAVYELKFTWLDGVPDLTWTGADGEEVVIGEDVELTTTTSVSLAHGPDDDSDDTNVPAAAETVP